MRQSFAAWFYAISNNLVKDELRQKRGIQFETMGEEDSLPPSRSPSPEEFVAGMEKRQKIEAALNTLPEAQLEVLIFSRFEGLKHAVIARITGKSEVAIRQLLYRALQNLRRELGEI